VSETAAGVRSSRAAGRVKVGFFTAAATLMAVIVFVAFSRTFYLRPLFETTDLSVRLGQDGLPFHLILHGLALSLWYALFCLQAWLVALRSVRFHRQIGYFGIAAAVAVIISGAVTTIRFVPRRLAAGGDYSMFSGIVVGNFLSLLVFSALIWLAISWRHRIDAHRRLMFLASVAILGPAFGGVRNRPVGAFLLEVLPDPFGIGHFAMTTILAVAALAAYDLVSNRRLHSITISCGPIVAVMELVVTAVARSDAGPAFAQWVGRFA
jgi:hypothetical protein